MATGREVVLRITANVTSLRAGMMSAAASVKDFEGQVVQVAKTSNETQRIAGKAMLGVGIAAAAGLALAVRSAIQFEQRMMNVATISGDVEKNFGAAGNAVLEMSGRLGVGANELAEALYDVTSSGFQGAAAMNIVEVAGIAAQAGLSSAAVAARAITGALNAYGLAASQAADVSDIFFQTVNLGIVTFEELAQNVGDFMGTANALGIALDQASAGFATITLAGVPAAEAATSLNAVMTQMLKPASEINAAFQALGYESSEAAIAALGLGGALQLVRSSLGDDKAAFAALFPEIRATRGALALTSQDGATYNRVAGEITDKNKRAGAAAAALAIQQKSLGGQLKIAKEQIVALAIGIGQSLLPALRPVVTLVQNVATGFAALGKGAQFGVAGLGLLGAGVLTLGGGLLLLGPKIAAAIKWYRLLQVEAKLLATTLRTTTLAMGAVGIALTAAAIGLAIYGNQKRKAKERTEEFVQALKDEKDGIEDSIDGLIRRRILESDLDKTASRLGISIETVARAMNGEKDAIDEVNAAADERLSQIRSYISGGGPLDDAVATERSGLIKLKSEIEGTNTERQAAIVEMKRQEGVEREVAAAAGQAAGGIGAVGDAAFDAAGYMDGLDDSQKKVLSSLQGMVDLSDIYVDGMKDLEDAEKDANRAQADRIRAGARATVDAMGKRHRAQRDALDAETITGKASQAAHDQRVENLNAQQDKEKEAMDTTVDSEGKRADAIEGANTRAALSLQSYLKLISDAGKAQLSRQRNLAVIKARGAPDDVIAELQELPDEYAGVIDEIARTSDAGFAEFVRTAATGSKNAVAATQAQFGLLPGALGEAGRLAGKSFSDKLLEEFRTGIIGIEEVVKRVTALRNEMIPVPGMPGAYQPRGGGPIATLAEGRVTRTPQIRTSAVLWAEAGAEAYIPLGAAHRRSAMAMTSEVGRILGMTVTPMAAGGMWGTAVGGADRSAAGMGMSNADARRLIGALEKNAKLRPAQMQNVFPPGIDPVHVAQKIAWRLRP